MKIGIGLPFKTSRDSWPAIEALARKADEGPYSSFAVIDRLAYDNYEPLVMLAALGPGAEDALRGAFADYYGSDPARLEARLARANLSTPEAIRDAIALHRDLGTDELVLKPASLAPDQFKRLTDVVANA